MKIPFVDLRFRLQDAEADWKRRLEGLFRRAHFVLGEELRSFEAELAHEFGARFAIGVGNGTDALELCLRAAGLSAGKQVITTPLTAAFTGLAILRAGLKPVFADVDPETLLLDPNDAGNRVTRRAAAILPVHLYGQPCDLPAFASVARSCGAALIQDACQAHGARLGGRPFTDFSPYVAYSFYPTKNLGCAGDGGAVLTNSISVARQVGLLRDGGRTRNHVSKVAGINSRLDEIQACFLRAFLPRLTDWNEQRRRLAAVYNEALEDCPGVSIVRHAEGSVHHLYVVRVRARERLRERLAQHGIGTAVHYPAPLHLQPAFRDAGLKRGALPVAEKACREILSLPLWPGMPESAACEVAERIRAFYNSDCAKT